jgi:catechol 2,3-dioxygenase-like lactoylglutathione lyase family enzyme
MGSARPDRVSELIPFVHVADVQRSIAFYKLLGFGVADTYEHDGRLDWAALVSEDAQLMLARADSPIDRNEQAVLFYLYADDLDGLDGLRDHLIAQGVRVGEIVDGRPGPEREMALADPDGYCLMIAAK